MAAEHDARLHGVEDFADGRHAVIGLAAVAQAGWAGVRQKHVDFLQVEAFVNVGAQEIRQALRGPRGFRIEVVVQGVIGAVQPGDAHGLGALGQGDSLARLDVVEMLQRPLAAFHLPHHVRPVVVADDPVHRTSERAVMTHVAHLQEGVQFQRLRQVHREVDSQHVAAGKIAVDVAQNAQPHALSPLDCRFRSTY